jgi:hypothetical protein
MNGAEVRTVDKHGASHSFLKNPEIVYYGGVVMEVDEG